MAATLPAERAEFVTATDATTYEIVAAGLGAFTPNANSTLVAFILGAETTDADLQIFQLVRLHRHEPDVDAVRHGHGLDQHPVLSAARVSRAGGRTPSSVATATATWSEGILACCASIGEIVRVNTTTPIKQSNTLDNPSGTNPSASLSIAPDSDSSTVFASIQRRSPPGWTPEAGWTEYMDTGVGTPVTSLYVAVTDSGPTRPSPPPAPTP